MNGKRDYTLILHDSRSSKFNDVGIAEVDCLLFLVVICVNLKIVVIKNFLI